LTFDNIKQIKFRKSRRYPLMKSKVKDLTVEELQSLISYTVKEVMEDLIEDILALSNEEYLKSIEEARSDYNKGKVKHLEEILNDI